MAKVINFPGNDKSESTRALNVKSSSTAVIAPKLGEIPIVRHALFLLASAGNDAGLKLTQTGALNRKFVQAFWNKFLAHEDPIFRPTRELDCAEVVRIHEILAIKEYVRKFKGKVKITASGKRILDEGPTVEFYRDLLFAGMYVWNWAYEDRYPEYEFIQASAVGMIELLWSWPKTTLTAVQFAEGFIETFDQNGKPIHMKYKPNSSYSFDTYDGMVRCLNLRFFQRFCVPFGILRDLSGPRLTSDPMDTFEKTDFFISDFPKCFEG